MRSFGRLLFFLAGLLAITGCGVVIASIDPSNRGDVPPVVEMPVIAQPGIIFSLKNPSGLLPETNECLNCHADKDRLVETLDPPKETAESESKGVG